MNGKNLCEIEQSPPRKKTSPGFTIYCHLSYVQDQYTKIKIKLAQQQTQQQLSLTFITAAIIIIAITQISICLACCPIDRWSVDSDFRYHSLFSCILTPIRNTKKYEPLKYTSSDISNLTTYWPKPTYLSCLAISIFRKTFLNDEQ